jgi:hypothetical protein
MLPENQRLNENGLDLSTYAQKKDDDLSRFVLLSPGAPLKLDLSDFTDIIALESYISLRFLDN